jgi:hypothetical protein
MKLLLYIFIGCTLLTACEKDEHTGKEVSANRTVILYMAADNDLWASCGLSCYIPHPARRDLSEYYNTLQWSIDLNNTQARQGEAPEVQPRGSALPP